jgi:hypothetical protein
MMAPRIRSNTYHEGERDPSEIFTVFSSSLEWGSHDLIVSVSFSALGENGKTGRATKQGTRNACTRFHRSACHELMTRLFVLKFMRFSRVGVKVRQRSFTRISFVHLHR